MNETQERDLLFCEVLFQTGSIKDTCEQLQVTLRTGRRILERNRHRMADFAADELASMSFKSVKTIKDIMDDPNTPKSEVALRAAESVLDRIGTSKRQAIEMEVKGSQPVILLPAKDVAVEAIEVDVTE
jgi:hypothetical protein